MVHVLLAVPLAGQLADTWECGLEWYMYSGMELDLCRMGRGEGLET